MGKQSKITAIDFQFGIEQIIPSTQEAFRSDEVERMIRKEEHEQLQSFKKTVALLLREKLKNNTQFPSSSEVFIFIIQYFASEKEYKRRDIDNASKTVLDVLKGILYFDDAQVKTLLIGKKMDQRIQQNFAYVAIKEVRDDKDIDALKISGIERSITLFHELRSRGYL